MAMCDASFIPLEQIKELLKHSQRDMVQEDYIALRGKIEKENQGIEDRISEIIENRSDKFLRYISTIDTDKKKFEKRLVDYAEAQMEYNNIKGNLQDIGREFINNLPELKQKTIKDHLLTIERYLAGYYATWILDIGLKAGLFAAIPEAPSAISAEELSWQLGLTPLYVEVWCKAAYGLELLDVDVSSPSKGYRLAPGIKDVLLDPTHPTSMRFDIAFSTALHQDFLTFPTYLRTGAIWPLADRPAALRKLYVEATMDDYPVITDVILPAMVEEKTLLQRLQTSAEVEILDVGTGAGFALIHYARKFPNAHVIGLDKDPACVAEAQRTVQIAVAADPASFKDSKQDSRITVRHQDVTTLTDQEKYDLIVINLVLYQIGISEYKNVFDRLRSALKPEGIVVISEYHFPDLAPERTYRFPGYQSFLSHLLHFALTGATMVPSKTLVDLLQDARFEIVRGDAIHHPLEERQVIVARPLPK